MRDALSYIPGSDRNVCFAPTIAMRQEEGGDVSGPCTRILNDPAGRVFALGSSLQEQ